jgi:T5SS/PEP-CTERM-associated repeat protein/autotransporter-associated beta strand protein
MRTLPFPSRTLPTAGGDRSRVVLYSMLLAIALCCLGSSSAQATTRWINTSGLGDWELSVNWDEGVPDSNQIAQIFNGGTAFITSNANAQDVFVGFNGDGNLIISNGGVLFQSDQYSRGFVGEYNSTASVTVSGTDSRWIVDEIFVGSDLFSTTQGGFGTLLIENGARVTSGGNQIGVDASCNGSATVTGTNSLWQEDPQSFSSEFDVGYKGTGQLTVSNGGAISFPNRTATLGAYAGSIGIVTVTGQSAEWKVESGRIFVGARESEVNGSLTSGGSGNLKISSGGKVTTSALAVLDTGFVEVNNGSITEEGLLLLSPVDTSTGIPLGGNYGDLTVGSTGTGRMFIAGGGLVADHIGTVGSAAGSSGAVAVSGQWKNSNDMVVGLTGTGTVEIIFGGLVSSLRGHVGFNSSGTGTVIVDGQSSKWDAAGSHFIGNGGTGMLEVRNGGSASTAGNSYLAFSANGVGSAVISGAGSSWTTAVNLYVGGNGAAPGGSGTLLIENGGTVTATETKIYDTGFLELGANPTLNGLLTLLGGHIEATDNTTFAKDFALGAEGVTVYTAGHNIIFGGVISGSGGLTKAGSFTGLGPGTLTLGGSNSYTGPTTVSFGKLIVNGSITSPVTVNSGTTLGGSGTVGGVTVNGGGIVAPGNSPGRLSINGTYNQTSSGKLAIELGGYTPGTGFDQLAMSGQALVGGTLNLSLVNGFRPKVGDTFAILTSSSESGNFSTVDSPGFSVRSDASPSGIVLTILGIDPLLRVLKIARSGNDMVITFDATAGKTYRLERKLALTDAAWQSISGVADVAASTVGPKDITDPGAITKGKAFYRVRLMP